MLRYFFLSKNSGSSSFEIPRLHSEIYELVTVEAHKKFFLTTASVMSPSQELCADYFNFRRGPEYINMVPCYIGFLTHIRWIINEDILMQ